MRGLQKFGLRFKLFKQKYQTSLKVHVPLHWELDGTFLQTLIKRILSIRGLQKFGLWFKLFKQKYQTFLKVHDPLYQEFNGTF